MISLLQTDSTHPDFRALVAALDAELLIRDGDIHAFYAQFNTIEAIKHAIIAYVDDEAVACGAIKAHSADAVEIKRMYTTPEHRGKGLARKILEALERWAAELQYEKCILETGVNQPEAIALYYKTGYTRIPNYGPYAGLDTSLCFEKNVR